MQMKTLNSRLDYFTGSTISQYVEKAFHTKSYDFSGPYH